MKILQIDEKDARRLHRTSSPEFKEILECAFGKDFFENKITDRIKTYEDACEELLENPINEIDMINNGFTSDEISYRKIKTITKALNEGWIPDWNNLNEKKWFPLFELSYSDFILETSLYYCSDASAGNGSRLCFKSDELAEYAGRQFTDLYKDFIK